MDIEALSDIAALGPNEIDSILKMRLMAVQVEFHQAFASGVEATKKDVFSRVIEEAKFFLKIFIS